MNACKMKVWEQIKSLFSGDPIHEISEFNLEDQELIFETYSSTVQSSLINYINTNLNVLTESDKQNYIGASTILANKLENLITASIQEHLNEDDGSYILKYFPTTQNNTVEINCALISSDKSIGKAVYRVCTISKVREGFRVESD